MAWPQGGESARGGRGATTWLRGRGWLRRGVYLGGGSGGFGGGWRWVLRDGDVAALGAAMVSRPGDGAAS